MSKGSRQRKTDAQKFAQGWEAVFGKKNPYMERAQLLAERAAMPDVTIAANMHKATETCSYPFCNCKIQPVMYGECVQGLPWKKEKK